ncbi:DUF905 family protein, partial [Escherichia coli]|uniref:DUF905 family protein n=1 Tax=Escherichia coli TaxID=562 RepID=UPI001115A0E2
MPGLTGITAPPCAGHHRRDEDEQGTHFRLVVRYNLGLAWRSWHFAGGAGHWTNHLLRDFG